MEPEGASREPREPYRLPYTAPLELGTGAGSRGAGSLNNNLESIKTSTVFNNPVYIYYYYYYYYYYLLLYS